MIMISFGVFENSFSAVVTGAELLVDFGGAVVRCVLSFPPSARKAIFIADSAIGNDAAAAGGWCAAGALGYAGREPWRLHVARSVLLLVAGGVALAGGLDDAAPARTPRDQGVPDDECLRWRHR